jgi:hypothetical protein
VTATNGRNGILRNTTYDALVFLFMNNYLFINLEFYITGGSKK